MRKLTSFLINLWQAVITPFRRSRLARILLLIVVIKFIIFYGFLKGFLYPTYLKPRYESDKHRSEQVMKDLLNNNIKSDL